MFRNLFRPGADGARGGVASVSVQELKAKLDAKESLVLVDVRQPEEFTQDGHVAGAKLIPLPMLGMRLSELPKDKPLFVICLSGSRSKVACDMLVRQGFSNVTNVVGGMGAWYRAGFPSKRG